jgi:hypothetical protein
MDLLFKIGEKYTRKDVQELLRVPDDRQVAIGTLAIPATRVGYTSSAISAPPDARDITIQTSGMAITLFGLQRTTRIFVSR